MSEYHDDYRGGSVAMPGGGMSDDSAAARLDHGHPLHRFLNDLVAASPSARFVRIIGELATALDGDPRVEGPRRTATCTAPSFTKHAGWTALGLATLWARWGHETLLVDLGSGADHVEGLLAGTMPDLAGIAAMDLRSSGNGEEYDVTPYSRLRADLPGLSVIAPGRTDVVALVSQGVLARFVSEVRSQFDRVVLSAPPLDTDFPVLAAAESTDAVVLTLVGGSSRSRDVEPFAREAWAGGFGRLTTIWYD